MQFTRREFISTSLKALAVAAIGTKAFASTLDEVVENSDFDKTYVGKVILDPDASKYKARCMSAVEDLQGSFPFTVAHKLLSNDLDYLQLDKIEKLCRIRKYMKDDIQELRAYMNYAIDHMQNLFASSYPKGLFGAGHTTDIYVHKATFSKIELVNALHSIEFPKSDARTAMILSRHAHYATDYARGIHANEHLGYLDNLDISSSLLDLVLYTRSNIAQVNFVQKGNLNYTFAVYNMLHYLENARYSISTDKEVQLLKWHIKDVKRMLPNAVGFPIIRNHFKKARELIQSNQKNYDSPKQL